MREPDWYNRHSLFAHSQRLRRKISSESSFFLSIVIVSIFPGIEVTQERYVSLIWPV